ncbi:MAG: diguanylate cyclase [Proteobacteria bacterium]|nr:diguanylate cyclase [Pseudomonadota bacterium]
MPLRRLTLTGRPRRTRFGVAAGIFAAALALRFALLPVDASAGFLTFYPAVVLVFYLCGTGPGLWVLALSALSGFYIFYPPFWSWVITPASAFTTVSFVVSSLVIGLVIRTLQRTNKSLAQALAHVELSDARWKALVTDQTDVIARFDAQGVVLFANDVAQRLFGPAARRCTEGGWKQAVHPEDLPQVLVGLAALTPANPQVRFDCRVVDVEGAVHWVDFVDHAFYDASGKLLEIQSIGREVTQRKMLEENLTRAEAELRDLYDNAPYGSYSLDAQGNFLRVNKAVEDLLGCPAAAMLHTCGPRDFASPDSQRIFDSNFRQLVDENLSHPHELDLFSTTGVLRHVRIHATAIRDAKSAFVQTRSAMVDISELSAARQALEAVVREQHAMLNNDLVGIVKLRERNAIWVNPALERLFGYAPGEMLGSSSRILYPDDESYAQFGRHAYPLLRVKGTYRTQAQLVKKTGESIWVDISGAMLSPEHEESLWMMLDITPMKIHEQRIEAMAYHDALTGLPNRTLLVQLLERELAARKRLDNLLCVCFIDLDGFKPINDTHGHEAGDAVLKVVGERLQESVRGNDIVARLGGDEFVVVLTHLPVVVVVRDTLQRLLARLRMPIVLQGCAVVNISASLGIALCPQDGQSVQELLRCADEAMYEAKGAGGNKMCFYAEVA